MKVLTEARGSHERTSFTSSPSFFIYLSPLPTRRLGSIHAERPLYFPFISRPLNPTVQVRRFNRKNGSGASMTSELVTVKRNEWGLSYYFNRVNFPFFFAVETPMSEGATSRSRFRTILLCSAILLDVPVNRQE